MMHMKIEKGFTLIEMLVVISIIGILSSIVFVSLKNAQDSSRIANNQTFATHTKHAFAAEAEALWSFDDVSGTVLKDFAAKHDGTLTNTSMISSVTPSNSGSSLYFNGSNRVTLNSVIVPDVTTISMWVKTSDSNKSPFFSNGVLDIGIYTQGGTKGKFWVNDSSMSPPGKKTMLSNKSINDNKWHHVAWTSNRTVSIIYIDGVEDNRDPRISLESTGVGYLGFSSPNNYFTGYLDEVAIYTQPLFASEVRDLYLAGLGTHQDLARE